MVVMLGGDQLRLANPGGLSPWSTMGKCFQLLAKEGMNVEDYCSNKVGDGKGIRFWLDVWLWSSSLKEQYPRVYALDSDPGALVCDRSSGDMIIRALRREPRAGVSFDQLVKLGVRLQEL